MTDIEQKALELVRAHGGCYGPALEAAIEAHESDNARHAAEMREQAERFSEAVTGFWNYCKTTDTPFPAALSPFILDPPDPLVEVVDEVFDCNTAHTVRELAADLRAALEARGLAIVKKEAVNG